MLALCQSVQPALVAEESRHCDKITVFFYFSIVSIRIVFIFFVLIVSSYTLSSLAATFTLCTVHDVRATVCIWGCLCLQRTGGTIFQMEFMSVKPSLCRVSLYITGDFSFHFVSFHCCPVFSPVDVICNFHATFSLCFAETKNKIPIVFDVPAKAIAIMYYF